MKITKEGYKPILIGTLIIAVLIVPILILNIVWLYSFLGLLAGLEILLIAFFRDPDRQTPDDPDLIISPADGKIILIQPLKNDDFIQEPATQVSIFMSVFNVHVNRIPIRGKVLLLQYKPGRFISAYKENAPVENEQMLIGIDQNGFRLKFKQIAGLIARRVICYLSENQEVKAGSRFGMIKFGSRVDLIFPERLVNVSVKLGDKVKAGNSIIGKIVKQ